jgi:hypothetical protein
MGGLVRGWALVGASWRVLLADKELALFPIISGICTLFAVAAFVLPAALLLRTTRGAIDVNTATSNPGSMALLFVFYLVTAFVTLFFNTALVGAALERLRGGNPNLASGLRIVLQHLPAIFVYALVTATVGLVLRSIERRAGFIGAIVASLFGAAWAVVTFLVVPVMVVEGQGPFASIKRSAALLKQTWGEQLGGQFGMSGVFFLLALPGVLRGGLGILSGLAPVMAAGIAVSVVYWAVLAVVASALNQIFRAAIYLYAAQGTVPAQFEPWMVQNAFAHR